MRSVFAQKVGLVGGVRRFAGRLLAIAISEQNIR
jgi:hypothetical protein